MITPTPLHFRPLFLLFAVLITSSIGSGSYNTNDDRNYVIKLDDANFEHTTQASTGQTTGKWFINFHSPNCGHCKKLAPAWSSLSKELKEVDEYIESGILIGSVDVKENQILSKRFGISKLPTLIFFAEESMFVYPPSNGRHVGDFVEFIIGSSSDSDGESAGYKKVERMAVPEAPGGVLKLVSDLRRQVYDIKVLKVLLDDVEHIIMFRKNAAALLVVWGIMIGFFLAILFGVSGGKRNDGKDGSVSGSGSGKAKNE